MSRPRTAGPLASLFAIIVGVTLLQGANGILVVILPLRLLETGFTALDVGIVATGYAAGFLAGCLLSGRLIGAIGHIRTYAVCAAGLSIATLAFTLTVDTTLWTVLRVVTGLCFAGLLTTGDSWIADRAPQDYRGRILSVYALMTKLAQMTGPLVLTVASFQGYGPILIIAALVSASLIPVAGTRSPSPSPPDPNPMRLRELFRVAPAAVTGAFATGLMNAAVIAMAPAWGTQIGLTAVAVAGLMVALQAGSLIGQWPMGWLSDRVDRRRVIVGGALLASVMGFLAAGTGLLTPLPDWVAWVAIALWAAPSLSIYSVCIAHAGDRAGRSQMVAATASLLLAWSAGSAVGPMIAAAAMEATGPAGLFLYAGAVAAVIAAFTLWRLARRAPAEPEVKEAFIPVPAASQITGELHPAADSGANTQEDAREAP